MTERRCLCTAIKFRLWKLKGISSDLAQIFGTLTCQMRILGTQIFGTLTCHMRI